MREEVHRETNIERRTSLGNEDWKKKILEKESLRQEILIGRKYPSLITFAMFRYLVSDSSGTSKEG